MTMPTTPSQTPPTTPKPRPNNGCTLTCEACAQPVHRIYTLALRGEHSGVYCSAPCAQLDRTGHRAQAVVRARAPECERCGARIKRMWTAYWRSTWNGTYCSQTCVAQDYDVDYARRVCTAQSRQKP